MSNHIMYRAQCRMVCAIFPLSCAPIPAFSLPLHKIEECSAVTLSVTPLFRIFLFRFQIAFHYGKPINIYPRARSGELCASKRAGGLPNEVRLAAQSRHAPPRRQRESVQQSRMSLSRPPTHPFEDPLGAPRRYSRQVLLPL